MPLKHSFDKCNPLIYYKICFSLARDKFGLFVKKSIHKNFTKPKEIKSYDTIKYGKRQCALK